MPTTNIGASDITDVLKATHTVFECKRVDELRREALFLFEKVFNASSSNFFLANGQGQKLNLNRVISRGIEDKVMGVFRRYYYKLDPFMKHFTTFDSPVLITKEIISFKKLMRTEYYNDFLRPQSIHDQMVIYMKSGDRLLGLAALFRPQKDHGFSHVDKAKAALMAPYLTAALEKAIVSKENFVRECIIDSIVSNLPFRGIIVLDQSLEPIYQNENAASILYNVHRTKNHPNSHMASLPKKVYLRCKEMLNSAKLKEPFESVRDHFDLICIGSMEKISLHIRMIPVPHEEPLLLLCLDPKETTLCLSDSLVRQGLTRREIDVVHLVAKGLKNTEIADKLFISPYTVDNHLKSIYAKMDVRNRTSLAHRLVQMTAMQIGPHLNQSNPD